MSIDEINPSRIKLYPGNHSFENCKLFLCPGHVTIKPSFSIRGKIPDIASAD